MQRETARNSWKTYLKDLTSARGGYQSHTPQSQPLTKNQGRNSAGGFVWTVDKWTRLDRFLVLGTEGGSYYIKEQALTIQNARTVIECIVEDGVFVVQRIVEISQSGRVPKNDPALFVLAICAAADSNVTRRAALEALPKVARTGTHLFHFLAYVEGFRGWGRGLRHGVANWYTSMPAERLSYQAVKYRQRDGWSHRDALRLAHPKAPDERHQTIYHWITKGWPGVGEAPHPDPALRTIWAFERVKTLTEEQDVINMITDHNLTWEAIPSKWLGSAAIWEALLPRMPLTAMLRNLARMTANGLLRPGSDSVRHVVKRVTDATALEKARIHPVAVLAAMNTYASGSGARGNLTWEPVKAIINALDTAFYLSFRNVEPSGKPTVLALDVSGSMNMGTIAGVPGLTPRVGSAAMALITAATEQEYTIVAFANTMVPVKISPRQRLDAVVREVNGMPFGATDCALPMIWAQKNRVNADTFVIYTDSETWFGKMHPAQALRNYRQKTGIGAKLVVVGMVANKFSIADPNDAGMLDVVGFDTATPRLIADFARGE